MNRTALLAIIALLLAIGVALLGWRAWQDHQERAVVTQEDDGSAVTRVITARLAGTSNLRVATLSGTIQASAQDVRWFGFLRSGQVMKAPYSVDYFVDVSAIGADDLEWVPASRTLIVNAPDVMVGAANVDEGAVSLVRTDGILVTREASQQLARRASVAAQGKATAAARSPERIAQARENARRALIRFVGLPVEALGYDDARIVVTFPPERVTSDGERWDVTRSVEEVLANRQ
ncbi:DUF4230 domain-containing protein [Sphingomonas sp. CJ99]